MRKSRKETRCGPQCGPGKRSGSDAVLVDKPAEAVYSLYATNSFELVVGQVGDRHLEVDPAVRALAVIVLDELAKDAVEVAFAPYEHPVQALSAGCPHKSFGERVRLRRPDGCLNNPGAGRAEYFVKGPDELGVAVADKEADGSALVFEGRYEVAGLLGDPRPDGVAVTPARNTMRRSRSRKNST